MGYEAVEDRLTLFAARGRMASMRTNFYRWFMPWQWPKWGWGAVAVFGVLTMPVPIERAIDSLSVPQSVTSAADVVYSPAWWCANRFEPAMDFYLWQNDHLTTILGPPKRYTKCGVWLDLTMVPQTPHPFACGGGFTVYDVEEIEPQTAN